MNGLKGGGRKKGFGFNTVQYLSVLINFRRVFVAKNEFLKLIKTYGGKRTLKVCIKVKEITSKKRVSEKDILRFGRSGFLIIVFRTSFCVDKAITLIY